MVYDITDKSSFNNCRQWVSEIERYACQSVDKILVGNKSDLEDKRQVDAEEGRELARNLGIPFIETSARTGDNVTNAFVTCSMNILKRVSGQTVSNAEVVTTSVAQKKKAVVFEDAESEEEFSDEEMKADLGKLAKEKKQKKAKKEGDSKAERVKHQKTDVNVFRLDLSNLSKEMPLMTGDPVACKHCGVLLNSNSKITMATREEIDKIITSQPKLKTMVTAPPLVEKYFNLLEPDDESNPKDEKRQFWNCEFCGHFNPIAVMDEEIPSIPCVDYLVTPPSAKEKNASSEDSSNIVFCIDISGSMCVTQEIKGKLSLRGGEKRKKAFEELTRGEGSQYLHGEDRAASYVTRLQCVQTAIQQQIENLAKEFPNRRVGIITFNHEVVIVGDGTSRSIAHRRR